MTDQTEKGKSRDGFALCHGTARGNTLQSSPLGCSLGGSATVFANDVRRTSLAGVAWPHGSKARLAEPSPGGSLSAWQQFLLTTWGRRAGTSPGGGLPAQRQSLLITGDGMIGTCCWLQSALMY